MNYIDDIDKDLGAFQYGTISKSWSQDMEVLELGRIMVSGRSRRPEPNQKDMLRVFLPNLLSLTEQARKKLIAPHEDPKAVIADEIILRELRFEPNGVVELFFNPGVWAGGTYLTPIATCNQLGEILEVDWSS